MLISVLKPMPLLMPMLAIFSAPAPAPVYAHGRCPWGPCMVMVMLLVMLKLALLQLLIRV